MNERRRPNRKAVLQTWAILGWVLIAALLAGSLDSYFEYRRIETQEGERLAAQATTIRENLQHQLQAVNQALLGLLDEKANWKSSPQGREVTRLKLKAISSVMPGVRTLLVLNKEGTTLISDRDGVIGENFNYREYFQTPLKNPDLDALYVSPPYVTVLGAYAMTAARVAPDESGQFDGIVAATLDPHFFRTLVNSVRYAPDITVSIVHGGGLHFLSVPEPAERGEESHAAMASFLTRHQQSGSEATLMKGAANDNGEERLIAQQTIRPAFLRMNEALVASVARPLPSIFADWRGETRLRASFLAGFAVLSILGLAALQWQRRKMERLAAANSDLREQAESRLRQMFEQSDAIMLLIDPVARRIVDANAAASRFYGYSIEELKSASIRQINPLPEAEHDAAWAGAIKGERNFFVYLNRLASGEMRTVEVRSSPIEAGGKTLLFSIVSDITERKRAEQELLASQERFRSILNAMNDGVYIVSPDCDLEFVNPAIENVFGPWAGKKCFDYFHGLEESCSGCVIPKVLGGTPVHSQWRCSKTGRDFDSFATRLENADGSVSKIEFLHDVTAIRKAEESLRASEQRMRLFFERQLVGMAITSPEKGWLQVNDRMCDLLGYSREELAHLTWAMLTHPEDILADNAQFDRLLAGEIDDYALEKRFIRKDGRIVDTSFSVGCVRKPDGAVNYVLALVADISERKRAEEALASQNALLRSILDVAPVGITITDEAGNIIDCNLASERLLGMTKEEHLARSFKSPEWKSYRDDGTAMPPEEFAGLQALRQRRLVGNQHMDIETRRGLVNLLVSAAPINLPGHGVVIAYADITAEKRLERILELSEERYKLAVDGANDGIWDWQIKSNDLYVSPVWKRQLGYEAGELESSHSMVRSLMHPEDGPRVWGELARFMENPSGQFSIRFRMRHKDGSDRWILSRSRVLCDHSGQPIRMTGFHTDITELKRAEDALAQRSLELERSNADLEQFAYAISHDLRQPLRAINSFTKLLERKLGKGLDEESRQYMGFVHDGALRLDQMIVSLLDFSKVGRGGLPQVPIESLDCVNEALTFLSPAIKEAKAEIRLAPHWPKVAVNGEDLTRLFLNLTGNAIKYRQLDRPPQISLETSLQDEGWTFRVTDNGIGIDPAQFKRLFRVFKRLHTKEKYEGTGIGLAICHRIVERYGGRIWVESAGEGQGCSFCFTLPEHERQVVSPRVV